MVDKYVSECKDYIIGRRREFHENPEESLKEFRTSKRIQEELTKMEIDFKVIAGTGVVATIIGGKKGKTLVLRADMDALQVKECTGVEYASKIDGLMHACGHDGHTAMLLGAAKILKKIATEIEGVIKFYFQPGEEVAQGAKKMIEEEPLDDVDGCFAIHLWSGLPIGKVSVEEGPRMSSADIFKIIIKGKGGHGSLPHQAIDSVVAGASLVMNLQSIVSREINPNQSSVITVGSFISGTRFNVIASEAVLEGTTRAFDKKVSKQIENSIKRITKSTCESYRTEFKVEYIYGTTPVINDRKCSLIAENSVRKILGENGNQKMEKITGGEDFCYFMEKVPGVLAFVGTNNPEKDTGYPHHHEKFNIDEESLCIGTELYVQYAIDFLSEN